MFFKTQTKSKNAKKDWHNYAQIAQDLQRTGPGEQGQGTVLPQSSEKSALFGQNGFNALASDKISLERSLNDIRHPKYGLLIIILKFI